MRKYLGWFKREPEVFSFWSARRCIHCHTVFNGRTLRHCPWHPQGDSIRLMDLMNDKNEKILQLQGMLRRSIRLIDMKDSIIAVARHGREKEEASYEPQDAA